MIYFVRSLKTGFIKIGASNNARKRIAEQRTEHGDLELLGLMDGDRQKEHDLHMQFKPSKANYRNEWFLDTPDLRAFIGQHCGTTPVRITRGNTGRKPINGRTATVNIKVSKATHEQMQDVASFLHKSHSEIILMGLRLLLPILEEEKLRRKQLEESVERRIRESQN